jgi:hypothetical protein
MRRRRRQLRALGNTENRESGPVADAVLVRSRGRLSGRGSKTFKVETFSRYLRLNNFASVGSALPIAAALVPCHENSFDLVIFSPVFFNIDRIRAERRNIRPGRISSGEPNNYGGR